MLHQLFISKVTVVGY